jgi:TonB family protein
MTSPSEHAAPALEIEPAPKDILPPSRDAARTITIGTILAALLLHLLFAVLLFYDWRPNAAPAVRPIAVTLVRQLPKPPPKPKPRTEPAKPKPKPETQKPKPKPKPVPKPTPTPAAPKPRESGPDQKTEAIKSKLPKPALPVAVPVAPQAPPQPPAEILPQPPAPKPVPPRTTAKSTARGHGVVVPLDRLPPALRPQRAAAPPIRNLMLRLPSKGGGGGTRNLAGDPYLNQLMRRLESNRVYPPAEDFAGALARRVIFDVVIDPSGGIVNITLIGSTGVTRLDEAAREMITNSAPFPRLPRDYPQIRTSIFILVPIFPR